MHFSTILARADEGTLQALIGRPALRLLKALDPALAAPSALRELLKHLRSADALLADPSARPLLLALLRPLEAQQLAILLATDPSSDSYLTLRTLNLRRGSARERLLFSFFELAPPTPDVVAGPSAQEPAPAQAALFPHQREAVRQVRAALSVVPQRVLLHLPTGAGKTRTAMHVIADHLRSREPALVVWLAASEELCEQSAAAFRTTWQSLGDREVTVQRFWGERELDLAQCRDGLLVAGLSKLYRATLDRLPLLGTLAARCSLVVIDEAHQAIAATYRLLLNTLVSQGQTALLGLTATPGRTWDDLGADAELAAFFGRRKVTLQVPGYRNPVDYLVDEGYLARVTFRPLLYEGGWQLAETDLRRIANELELPARIVRRLAEDEQRNLALVVAAEALARDHQRIMLFAASVEHAYLVAAILRARGLAASALSGETPSAERARMIAAYKDNTPLPRILCNFGVLTTGFDAPRTSAALIARPTRSLVLYSQMVGRAIRGPRVGGNPTATVVTVIDRNLPGFGDVAEAFSNWEDVWNEP